MNQFSSSYASFSLFTYELMLVPYNELSYMVHAYLGYNGGYLFYLELDAWWV